MISPQALEFNARQIVFNDQLARILVIAGYPPKVNAAWLSRIAGMPGV
ncbi:type IV secretory pathway VirB4 components-like protein, partial [Thermoanaerobacter ethanolicus JW 200]